MISKHRIFLLIFLPAAIILAAGAVLVQEKNKALSAEQFEALLKNQWLLVSMLDGREGGRETYGRIAAGTGLRITLVSAAGEVLYDSSAADGRLESHSDRAEIKGAFAGSPTMAMRRSESTGVPTIYFADRLDAETALRVAYPAEYYERQERALLGQTLGGLCVLAAAVAAFALLAYRRASMTMRELGEAVDVARKGGEAAASFGNECLDGALNSLSGATRRLRELDRERAALNRRLEYILENIRDGVILFRGDEILYSNASAARVLGAEVPGAVSEAGDPAIITVLEALATREAAGELRAGGRVIAVSVAGEGDRDDGMAQNGREGEGRVVILHDLTDREKYDIYKSDLAGNISHELKTPLAVILTASEVTIREPGMPEETRMGFLETIRRNVLRLSAILDDLNYLQRLETVDEAAGAEADLEAAMTEAKENAGSNGKKVVLATDGETVAVYGPHLESVAANLIANAVKYSDGDTVNVRAAAANGTVTIEVEDGGPAIPASERERIFERFYSLSKSRNREKSGSGLGLSIVKHIAMIYDGEAVVLDNARGGNTFRVSLKERRRQTAEFRGGSGDRQVVARTRPEEARKSK
ncbi:MAG: PAS domain-containing protein [Deltaproteobacteria bacterium]|nr:PAS domain-containing protein [Deltaproteobacteria bacterium]